MIRKLKKLPRRVAGYYRWFGPRGLLLMIRLHWLYARNAREPVFVGLQRDGIGIWIRPRLDLGIFHQVFVLGEYAFNYEDSPNLIVDGGANIGCATVYFAQRFPHARIIAVEPCHDTFALLKKNIEGLDNVAAIEAAIWHESELVEIIDPSVHHLAIQVGRASGAQAGTNVKGVTIPEIIEATDSVSIDLLKLDIEGAEDELFAHDSGWLPAVNSIVIEFHNDIHPGSESRIREKISEHWRFREECRGENVLITRTQ